MCHKVLDTVLLQEFEKEEKATSRELIIAKRSERRDDLVGVRLGAGIGAYTLTKRSMARSRLKA